VFAKGHSSKDIKGRGVGEVDVDIEVDGIKVKSGDFIFADNDAVIIIPRGIMPIIKDNIIKAVKE
jgi:regulator of RNase E activity RraA